MQSNKYKKHFKNRKEKKNNTQNKTKIRVKQDKSGDNNVTWMTLWESKTRDDLNYINFFFPLFSSSYHFTAVKIEWIRGTKKEITYAQQIDFCWAKEEKKNGFYANISNCWCLHNINHCQWVWIRFSLLAQILLRWFEFWLYDGHRYLSNCLNVSIFSIFKIKL